MPMRSRMLGHTKWFATSAHICVRLFCQIRPPLPRRSVQPSNSPLCCPLERQDRCSGKAGAVVKMMTIIQKRNHHRVETKIVGRTIPNRLWKNQRKCRRYQMCGRRFSKSWRLLRRRRWGLLLIILVPHRIPRLAVAPLAWARFRLLLLANRERNIEPRAQDERKRRCYKLVEAKPPAPEANILRYQKATN